MTKTILFCALMLSYSGMVYIPSTKVAQEPEKPYTGDATMLGGEKYRTNPLAVKDMFIPLDK